MKTSVKFQLEAHHRERAMCVQRTPVTVRRAPTEKYTTQPMKPSPSFLPPTIMCSKETDTRFAVESGIDHVFQGFSCEYVHATSTGHGISRTGDREAVQRLRATLARIGYNARTIQRRFGVSDARRLPGPYYLRKNFDHNHVRDLDNRTGICCRQIPHLRCMLRCGGCDTCCDCCTLRNPTLLHALS